jgi:hypothetical protein
LNYGANAGLLQAMTTINSELERLRAASPLDRPGIFKGICANFSSGTIAKALCPDPPRKKVATKRTPKPGTVDRAGRPLSDR